MTANRSERRIRIGAAVVFLLLTVVVMVPLADSAPRSTLDRTFRIAGGTVLLLLAALSVGTPGGRSDPN